MFGAWLLRSKLWTLYPTPKDDCACAAFSRVLNSLSATMSEKKTKSPGKKCGVGLYRPYPTVSKPKEPQNRIKLIHRRNAVILRSKPKLRRRYVNNKLNRSVGRVGKVRGTHILHNDGTVTLKRSSSQSKRRKSKARSQSIRRGKSLYTWKMREKRRRKIVLPDLADIHWLAM